MRTFGGEKTKQGAKGQTLVEFALVAILLFAILFGIIEFGRAWFYSNHLGNSVRAAARYGAVLVNSSTTDAAGYRAAIRGYLTNEIDEYIHEGSSHFRGLPDVIFYETNDDGTLGDQRNPGDTVARGDTLRVTVNYNFDILTASVIPYFRGTVPLSRTATMPVE